MSGESMPCWECGAPSLTARVRLGRATYYCHGCMVAKWGGSDDEGSDTWVVRRASTTG